MSFVLGGTSEWRIFDWNAPYFWIPDFVTGSALLLCGFIGLRRLPHTWSGSLLAAAGLLWFVPNIVAGSSGWLAAHTLYLHRGPLVQLALTFPHGKPHGRVLWLGVIVGWLAAVTSIWQNEWTAIAAAAALVGFAYGRFRASIGPERRRRAGAARSTFVLCAVFVVVATVRLATPTAVGQESTILFYEAAVSLLGVATLVGLLGRPTEQLAVTDILVDLTDKPSPELREALARALAAPDLTIGYWIPGKGAYVDDCGREFQLATAGAGVRVISVEKGGEPAAVLVHEGSLNDDPVLADAIVTAVRLAGRNVSLHHELLSQIAEVAASRRRLLVAADQERGRLATRLRQGPAAELKRVLETVESAGGGSATPPTLARIERARYRLSQALQELDELASGLHPRAVTEAGLRPALTDMAERGPVPVRIDVAATDLPEDLEVAIYFICSEGVANIAKHAQATYASIVVADSPSGLEIVLEDDGRGGADLTAGSGLAGLRDRVETLGGVFEVASSAELGTRLRAVIPRPDIEAERERTGREAARA